jgi:antitoxin VapB
VRALQAEAAASRKPLRIHVERFNPALRLYERLGFRQIADRGGYLFMEWRGDINSQPPTPNEISLGILRATATCLRAKQEKGRAGDLTSFRPSACGNVAGSCSICTAYAVVLGGRVNPERQVRLFRNGRNQALRIPRDLELPGRVATLRKEGPRLVVEPVAAPSLLQLLAKLKPLDEDLLPIPRLEAEPIEL